jgi:hypothetical protein
MAATKLTARVPATSEKLAESLRTFQASLGG